MTPQELQLSILEQAFQGKLTEQLSREGTGAMLLEKIRAEKQRLMKAKRIKKEKKLPEILDDDVPFDIPESWTWAYVGDIFLHNTGKAQNSSGSEAGVVRKFITTSNLYWNRFDFSKVKEMPFTEQELQRCTVRKGDLLVCEGGDCGRSAIWYYDEEVCIQNHVHRLRPYVEVSVEYFYHLFYLYKFTGKLKGRGVGIQGLSNEAIHKVICPLPPLAEQKRIVARIEELLPYVARYEKAWSKLEDFNKRFPEDMRKSILQLAIQGKLVEQRPEEGTGEELLRQIQKEKQALIKSGSVRKEKPMPEITEDEIPFDIPEGWKWCRLSALGITQTGNTPPKSHPEYIGRDIPFITPGDILNNKISYDNQALSLAGKGVARVCGSKSILQVCIGGSIGKGAITDREAAFNQQINAISPIICSGRYLFTVMQSQYFLSAMKEKAGGTATPIINRRLWESLLIPLPPLAEQARIVAKLEELLPLCERLK